MAKKGKLYNSPAAKAGRDRYKSRNTRRLNKERKLACHVKKFPNDAQAAKALSGHPVVTKHKPPHDLAFKESIVLRRLVKEATKVAERTPAIAGLKEVLDAEARKFPYTRLAKTILGTFKDAKKHTKRKNVKKSTKKRS